MLRGWRVVLWGGGVWGRAALEVDMVCGSYSEAERSELPQLAADASLGCGNPVALATLSPGEVVLDLGSGGGIDVLLSARRVAPGGRVYGLDMTDEMLELARRNQAEAGVENAVFLKGEIEEVMADWRAGDRMRVLFLCTHNSARSQMAEGLLRGMAGDRFEVFSAGTEATRVRPEAISVMAEIGLDISAQESESLDCYLGETLDLVVTVCDDANEACPVFPGARERLHWFFPDPSKAAGGREERLQAFRDVRDEIRARIEDELAKPGM